MQASIDLQTFFTPDAIKQTFLKYKESKTDRYHPEIVRIPMGADGITWEDFEQNLDRNAANISRRVLNGSYQFYPLRIVEKEKKDGTKRPLAIASIRDALVQRQLYQALYESTEAMFAVRGLNQVSFAYRKGKSAPRAARRLWHAYKRQGYRYALDADIVKFFDSLNHDRLKSLIDDWVGLSSPAGKLLWRYIRIEMVPYNSYPHGPGWRTYFMTNKPVRNRREMQVGVPQDGVLKGVPQGGVLSGMLANLYLHELDRWIVDDLRNHFDVRYFRYADDFVILTRTEADAKALHELVAAKLDQLNLVLHPTKTEVRDIEDPQGLTFVGFHFTRQFVKAKQETVERFQKRFMDSLAREREYSQEITHWFGRLVTTVRFCVNPKISGPEPETCTVCQQPMTRRRNWTAFFASAVTDVDQLRQLDRWMRGRICKYFRDRYRVRLGVKKLRRVGLKSLVSEYYRQRRTHTVLCQCNQPTNTANQQTQQTPPTP